MTLGHHKRTDLPAESGCRFLRIQVKAKQGTEWPSAAGIYTPDDFLIIVDFVVGDDNQPHFYVIDLEARKNLLQKEKERHPAMKVDEKLTVHYPDGWKRLNIRPSAVQGCSDHWDKNIRRIAQPFPPPARPELPDR